MTEQQTSHTTVLVWLTCGLLLFKSLTSSAFSLTSVGGYFSSNDGFQHAIAATDDDALHEIFFNPSKGVFRSELGCFGSIGFTSSFYSSDDGMQHVIVAARDGAVREVYFSPATGVHASPPLITLPSIRAISAFYAEDDHNRIVLIATNDGGIREVFYNPTTGVHGGNAPIVTLPNIVGIAGFYTPDDKTRHIIVATSNGKVSEVFYTSSTGVHVSQPALGTFVNIVAVSGFYSADDHRRHAIVATSDGQIREIFYGGGTGSGTSMLQTVPGVVSVASYYTPSDRNRHVILGLSSGQVREVFFNPTSGIGNDLLATMTEPVLAVEDVSPDVANASKVASPSSAGLAVSLAGDVSALYTVALNAGVWKSVSGGAWQRLPQSPRYAYSIAVDPNNRNHLAVGERAGDATDHHKDGAGVWESADAGASWKYAFDPLTQNNCDSQAIPSVAFSRKSTLFIATNCGVGRRAAGAATFSFSTTLASLGPITAVTTSDTKVWARSASGLAFSTNEGQSWTVKSFPPNVSFPEQGDTFSLAAFDSAAYMSCCSDATPPCGNMNRLLVYSASSNAFIMQKNLFTNGVPQLGCSGTGLGGSRFVKAYSHPSNGTVSRQLFYGSAQEVYEASAFDPNGLISQWTRPLGATCPGCTDQDPVHSDLWDFHQAPDGAMQWASCDGGVYERATAGSTGWLQLGAGLHTHHAHTLTALRDGASHARLAYPTSDNDAWFFLTKGGWDKETHMGDVNWSAGDAGNPNVALMVRQTGPRGNDTTAMLTGFGSKLPGGLALELAQLNNDGSRDGPRFFNFIQSLSSETPATFALDALMLANLPLQFVDTDGVLKPVPGTLGLAPGGGFSSPVLLRNSNFAATPDIDVAKGKGWSMAANNLPAGTTGFVVSAGHANPVVYVYADQGDGLHVYRGTGIAATAQPTWVELNVQGDVQQAKPFPPSGLLGGGATNGPLFVNPYDANDVYVLTDSGVRHSINGGNRFDPDSGLTDLITSHGKYPLTGTFGGGNADGVRIASRAVSLATLSDVDFCRDNPKLAVASSPFTGLFYRSQSGQWHDLSDDLPKPTSAVSAVRMTCNEIYATTEGGGTFRITGFRSLH